MITVNKDNQPKDPKGVPGLALFNILKEIDPQTTAEVDIEEASLDPEGKNYEAPLPQIFQILSKDSEIYPDWPHRDLKTIKQKIASKKSLFSSGKKNLDFDFYLPSLKIIVELDEVQHFTRERLLTLAYYPTKINMGVDLITWAKLSQKINKTDEDGKRDWERAFRDAVRDFELHRLGQSFARIGEFEIPGLRKMDTGNKEIVEAVKSLIYSRCSHLNK